ncbi:sensitive to high expression protein 9 [Microdochium nivale]|nr:sensitive to high expression protein 9 [Microdochium nivale]
MDFEHLKPQFGGPQPEHQIPSSRPPPRQTEPEVTPSSSAKPAPTTPKPKPSSPPPPREDPSLPSSIRSKTSPVAESISNFIDRAQTTLFTASQRINDLTGYSGIETLKDRVDKLEQSLEGAQVHLHDTRLRYKSAVAERASTQREVTTLLARQKTWTPNDFERFTSLYRQDYELEASVTENAAALEEAEREAERLNRELSSGILARYHEEQIWSDKIRRMSTWGTWGLMGVNIFLFLVLQFGAEPWRRQRLVNGFEQKVREALEYERELRTSATLAVSVAPELSRPEGPAVVGSNEIDAATPTSSSSSSSPPEPTAVPPVAASSSSPQPLSLTHMIPTSWEELIDPEYWKAAYAELTSDRPVALQMRDLSLIVLEGVATGAVAVASSTLLFGLLFRSSR